MHAKDQALLEKIKEYFGAGKIYIPSTREAVNLEVRSLKDLLKIVKHFDRYPLMTQKLADLNLFKKALELINNKEHRSLEGLIKIVALKASMNRGLPEELKLAFPGVVSVTRPLVLNKKVTDPN